MVVDASCSEGHRQFYQVVISFIVLIKWSFSFRGFARTYQCMSMYVESNEKFQLILRIVPNGVTLRIIFTFLTYSVTHKMWCIERLLLLQIVNFPFYSLTILQFYSLTFQQSYSLPVLQSHNPTVLWHYNLTNLQSYRPTFLMFCCSLTDLHSYSSAVLLRSSHRLFGSPPYEPV